MILKHHITTKNLENGRSMVEMLGTLAIIGVLSVGAIAGYSYGMDKYRANETINDVMLLGVDVITQASRTGGMPNLSAEWGTKTTVGYDFTVVPNPEDAQYGIQISGVPARVCKMVGDALKPMASVYVNDDEYITEEDPCDESDNNTMKFYFATGAVESDGCKTDADCGTNKYCDMDTGFCFNGSAPEGTYGACTTTNECCIAGDSLDYKNGDDCTINTPNDGMCYYGKCVAKGCTYDKNKCTGFGVYCASPNAICTEAFPSGKTGTCVEADFAELDVGDKTYYVSHHYMSWWDADAACKALGRDGLVGVSDLINGWNGGYDANPHEFTDLGKALQSHYGTDWYVWTNYLPSGVNSCIVYPVSLYDGNLNYNLYRSNRASAVCR